MKINEIPEKIYLSYETDDEDYKDHIFIDYMWHRHPFEGKNLKNIEYTRTDASIEKVIKYLYDNNKSFILTEKDLMSIKQHKLYVPKLEDFENVNDFLKACSLYNKLIEERK